MSGNGDEHLKLHINLWDEQVEDYRMVQEHLGIQNHNDLVRYLVRQEAHRIRGAAPAVVGPASVSQVVQSRAGAGARVFEETR